MWRKRVGIKHTKERFILDQKRGFFPEFTISFVIFIEMTHITIKKNILFSFALGFFRKTYEAMMN